MVVGDNRCLGEYGHLSVRELDQGRFQLSDFIPTFSVLLVSRQLKGLLTASINLDEKGNNYNPPMKLREDNVFSRVCPSVILFTGEEWWGCPM